MEGGPEARILLGHRHRTFATSTLAVITLRTDTAVLRVTFEQYDSLENVLLTDSPSYVDHCYTE